MLFVPTLYSRDIYQSNSTLFGCDSGNVIIDPYSFSPLVLGHETVDKTTGRGFVSGLGMIRHNLI